MISSFENLSLGFKDNLELLEMADSDKDEALFADSIGELEKLAKIAKEMETLCLFSGEVDKNDCFLEVHAGAGGTESHDWANMLLRMYIRWAESHKYKIEYISELGGEEVGIKSATLKIIGHNAYGQAKCESGVHRLVRLSPFNAQNKRQTSFASIWVFPVIDDNINIEINESELRIDTYRSSGAGGQHVNTTDSAVRITHLPTNIAVQCQSDRSQHRNKAEAMNMLKSRLFELEMKKREAEADIVNASKTEIGWGHQIRSYVLHPYQMVKDLRTDHETSNTSAVLDGALDDFILARLKQMAVKSS